MFVVILDYSKFMNQERITNILMPADKKRDDEIDWADLLEGINHLYLLRLQVGPMTKTEGKCLFRGKFSSTF